MDSGWECLPRNLLESILDKVETQLDYLQFGLVCGSWRSLIAERKQKSQANMKPQVPILLVPSSQGNHSHELYDVVTQSYSKSKLFVPCDNHFAGFSLGWLFTVEQDYSIKLHKAYPINASDYQITSTTVHLPPLLDDIFMILDCHIFKAAITADPLTSPESRVVAVIFGLRFEVAFIRPGKESSWTGGFDQQLDPADEIMFYNDKLYVATNSGKVFSVECRDQSPVLVNIEVPDIRLCYANGKIYIVESEGNLLLIVRTIHWDPNRTKKIFVRRTKKADVYRLDVAETKWVEVPSIGQNALFLGDNNSMSVSCLDFPQCNSNCIYYAHDNDRLLSTKYPPMDFGVYDLGSRTMALHFGIDRTKLFGRVPIWVVPYAR